MINLSNSQQNHRIKTKQGVEELYTQRLKERNGYSLKLSQEYLETLNKLRPHRLKLHRLSPLG